jgi:ABC-type nickel/cobalt efflux system permease component RcnA
MRGPFNLFLLFLPSLCALCLCGESVFAHPVPKENHDRVVEVRLTPSAVVVAYHLEVNEIGGQLEVVRELSPREQADITTADSFHKAYIRHFAPLLADNLFARLDGKPLAFTGTGERNKTVTDSLRYDFTYTAPWKPAPGRQHTFTLREANYDQEDFDRLELTVTADPGVTLQNTTVPDKTLLERPPLERKPGDAERLRNVSATFVLAAGTEHTSAGSPASPQETTAGEEEGDGPAHNLLHLLLDTRRGLAVLLLLAAGFGAVHALTPGHGKTLVAAYLVGEHGTVWHALLLGLMTTLTHTGAVFLLAVVFLISPESANIIYYVQGLVGGLFIAALGLWLLFTRLSGRADHFHFGGHSHHHHHDHDHAQDHTHDPIVPEGTSVRGWHLVLLGMRGGLAPCWDAILLLCLAISAQRLWLGVPLLLAFSAGLAGVLVALGVGVVWARNWAVARWGEGARVKTVVRMLPLVSAALITGLGLWLCYDSLHPQTPPAVHSSQNK